MLSNNSQESSTQEKQAKVNNAEQTKTQISKKNWKHLFYEIPLPRKKYLPASLHIGYFLISFAVAFLLWFSVADREDMEVAYTVLLEYNGLPKELIITEGLQESVHVRIKSTASWHDALKNENLTFEVDLSGMQKGANVINLELEELFNRRNYEIISLEPAKLLLVSDNLAEKDVKIDVYIASSVKNANRIIGKPQVDPSQIRIKGPESEVSKINAITLPFSPNTENAAGKYTESLAVTIKEQVEASPPLVRVNYEIKSGLVTVNYIVPVKIVTNDNNAKYTLSEEKVTLNVLMPDHLIRDEKFIEGLSAYVVPTGALEETVILRFKLPPTAKLQSSSIDKVVLKKIQ